MRLLKLAINTYIVYVDNLLLGYDIEIRPGFEQNNFSKLYLSEQT